VRALIERRPLRRPFNSRIRAGPVALRLGTQAPGPPTLAKGVQKAEGATSIPNALNREKSRFCHGARVKA
jgi:hypothetical protein